MKSPCLRDSEKGECEPCEFDTFTEHGNGLKKCLSCIKCRSGESVIFNYILPMVLMYIFKIIWCAHLFVV